MNENVSSENHEQKQPTPKPQKDKAPVVRSKLLTYGLLLATAVVVIAVGYGLYSSEGKFLLHLQETDVSRGLITFLVAIITVSISLILVVWVLVSNLETEELKVRFTSAKEVFATLVGILGTILGFYFGSVGQDIDKQLTLAELKFKNKEVIIHAAGGVPPYRFTTNIPGVGPENAQVSNDGWLFVPIPAQLELGSLVTVEVTDSKDKTKSQSNEYKHE